MLNVVEALVFVMREFERLPVVAAANQYNRFGRMISTHAAPKHRPQIASTALAYFVLAGIANAAVIADREVEDIARRLRVLTAKESVWPRIDTELRAAALLNSVKPGDAAEFRDDAIRLLLKDRSVPVTDGMAASLRSLDPGRAAILGGRPAAKPAPTATEASAAAARGLLDGLEHGLEHPDGYARLAALRREMDLPVGGDNASPSSSREHRKHGFLRHLAA